MSDSGAQTLIGYRTHRSDDGVTIHLDVEERHLNRSGLLHGGIASTLLDAVSGYAAERALALDEEHRVVTVALTTNYHAAGRLGDALTATARAVGKGRTLQHTAAELRTGDGGLIASANGIFKRIRARRHA